VMVRTLGLGACGGFCAPQTEAKLKSEKKTAANESSK